MSKENPSDDPRQRTDWKSSKQSDQPWKGSTEKEQKPGNEKRFRKVAGLANTLKKPGRLTTNAPDSPGHLFL